LSYAVAETALPPAHLQADATEADEHHRPGREFRNRAAEWRAAECKVNSETAAAVSDEIVAEGHIETAARELAEIDHVVVEEDNSSGEIREVLRDDLGAVD